MRISGEYREAYPRAGDVALLCEGDLIGYEAALLRRWVDSEVGTSPLVDIWACGTSTAVFGLCDAIGRSRPLLVIEDRDFRTKDEAEKDCREVEKDRQKRGLRLLGWRAWQRNEIENYLVEPEVVSPVMAEAFRCTEEDVQQGLSETLAAMSLYQATQHTLYRARKLWGDSRLPADLVPGVDAWPSWDDERSQMSAPEPSDVRGKLEKNLARLSDSLSRKQRKWDNLNLLKGFDETYEAWSQVTVADRAWRVDWSGKEVLQSLRIWLAARYGWPDILSGERQPLKWAGLKKTERDAQDRPLEAALRPRLVTEFMSYLTALRTGDIPDEFAEIRTLLSKWKSAS